MTNPEEFQLARERLERYGMSEKQSSLPHAALKRASVLALISNDGKVLLNQRNLKLKSHPGHVCFPGGKQDASDEGDDLLTALRETREEVGLHLATPTKSATRTASHNAKHNTQSTAERSYQETHETRATTSTVEHSLEQRSVIALELLCRMPTIESINHLCVTPFVGWVDLSSTQVDAYLELNPQEVEQAFWVPLQFFVQAEPVLQYPMKWAGGTFVYREYEYTDDRDFDSNDNNNKDKKKSTRGATAKFTCYPRITGLTAHMVHEMARIAYPVSSNGSPAKRPRRS